LVQADSEVGRIVGNVDMGCQAIFQAQHQDLDRSAAGAARRDAEERRKTAMREPFMNGQCQLVSGAEADL